jgi:hypothetical protein
MANPLSQTSTSPDPIKYVPSNRRQQILALQIGSISVAGHNKTGSGHTFVNHWCLYLHISLNKSIRIDCQPSHSMPSTVMPGGSKAFVIVSELPYALSRDVIKPVKLTVRPGLTVQNVIDLLTSNGRHKYEFNKQGVGCRYWTTDQVNLLEQRQFAVDHAQCEAARQAILKLWPDETHLVLDAGAYYQ